MRELLIFRSSNSSDPLSVSKTMSTQDLLEDAKLCPICYDYKNDVRDWNCDRGCMIQFCKACRQAIDYCPDCRQPYGVYKDNDDIPEEVKFTVSSRYFLQPYSQNLKKIQFGNNVFYMTRQDYKPKEISSKERNILGGLLKQIRGDHTAYETMTRLSGKGLKLDVYEEWDDENDSGNFKVVITKLNQEQKSNIEKTHSFIGDDAQKSVYINYEQYGVPSPLSSVKRKASAPPPVEREMQPTKKSEIIGPKSLNF